MRYQIFLNLPCYNLNQCIIIKKKLEMNEFNIFYEPNILLINWG